jgi:hypothetical protein
MNTETRMREIGDELERAFEKDLRAEAAAAPARRRRGMARPALAGGVGMGLAAVGVAIALVAGGGHAASTVGATHTAAAAPGGPSAVDTAYIIKRVKAKVAAATPSQFIVSSTQYDAGNVRADGSGTPGAKVQAEGIYQAADGTVYRRQEWFGAGGKVRFTISDAYTPNGSGKTDDAQTVVNPSARTYNRTTYRNVPGPNAGGATLGVTSSATEVQQALQTGQVSQSGTTTLDGRTVLVLTVRLSSGGGLRQSMILYVDPDTYQPLQDAVLQILTLPGTHDRGNLTTDDWEPVTQANIAAIEDASVPAGYDEVSKSQAIGR